MLFGSHTAHCNPYCYLYKSYTTRSTRHICIHEMSADINLFLMIIPHYGGRDFVNIFRNYYKNRYMHDGNGVIWSNIRCAREEEFNYFRKEISKSDIAIVDLSKGSQSVPLGFRLQVNANGRRINSNDANLKTCYLMFYCVPLDDCKACEGCKWRRSFAKKDNPSALFIAEKFLNHNLSDELEHNQKIVIRDGYIF